MFIDKVNIYIKAGNGGNGCVSFRREKYVAKGGPDGGDGGRGGNVIFVVDEGESTLVQFKYKRKLIAENGAPGGQKKFFGKWGEDLIIKVPKGTVIKDAESGRIINDMSDGKDFTAAKGGKGGWGNLHFATATRQVPNFAKSGLAGEEYNLTLELKMLADVGLVGFPNVGKSTLLSQISAARPKIANYHFTTLSPNLGVVSYYDKTFVVADIPGLVEGASEGIGLGHDFLRHIDRCNLIVHIVDISASEREDPAADIKKINSELKLFSPELAARKQIIAANKIDLGYDESKLKKVAALAKRKNCEVYKISGATGEGIGELMAAIVKMLNELPPMLRYESEIIAEDFEKKEARDIFVNIENGVYFVTGEWLTRLIANINFDDYESLQYFQKVLRNSGVIDALEKAGIEEGCAVDIYGVEFEFYF